MKKIFPLWIFAIIILSGCQNNTSDNQINQTYSENFDSGVVIEDKIDSENFDSGIIIEDKIDSKNFDSGIIIEDKIDDGRTIGDVQFYGTLFLAKAYGKKTYSDGMITINNAENLAIEKYTTNILSDDFYNEIGNNYCVGETGASTPDEFKDILSKYYTKNDIITRYKIQNQNNIIFDLQEYISIGRNKERPEKLSGLLLTGFLSKNDITREKNPSVLITVMPNKFGASTEEELEKIIGKICAGASNLNIVKVTKDVIVFASACGTGGGTNLFVRDTGIYIPDQGDLDVCEISRKYFLENYSIN